MALFTGSGVAIITPFDESGEINYTAFEELIEFQIKNKTDAIIVCGTTGEASALTDDEQLECIRFAVSVVNKRVPVIAGAGSNYTEHGVYLCKGSEKAGADGLLIVTPYYNKCTQKGLVKHYKTLAASVNLPIIVYSVKARTSLNIEPETAYELSRIDNIIAIKEASSDIVQIARIAELCGDDLALYSGNDDQNVPILSLGGIGCISVAANVAPLQTHEMMTTFLSGDIKTSLRLQLEMLPLIRALFNEVNPIPVKAALNLMGFNAGVPRMPLTEIEDVNLARLKQAMTDYGLAWE